ncbi:hypothetical protein FRC12_020590 [Ceratobasidium sp. 428]|nr:hypothetical protein FRC12_020590 [Ceratobasidium sp. 428]
MPDAAYVHLRAKKAHFVCHRCHSEELLTWEEIIEHYREMNEKWENETRRRPKQMTKHKIIFTNAHELQPHAGLEKERYMRIDTYLSYGYRGHHKVECKLCLVGWPSTTYDHMLAITKHLRNVHGVTGEPLENLHYGERTELFDMAQYKTEWCTRWDSYHN